MEKAMPRVIHAPDQLHLSRRERQIMDILYREGRAAAGESLERLPAPPRSSALRALARASAASRHLVAFLGLALALAVPVLGLVVPRWEIPVLSAAERPSSAPRPALADPLPAAVDLAGFSGRVGVQVPPLEEP